MFNVFSNELAFPELFELVQTSEIFPDSKVFVDAIALYDPVAVNQEFLNSVGGPDFDLILFLQKNFKFPAGNELSLSKKERRSSLREHLDDMWITLERASDKAQKHSSLVFLPHKYLVPGGRFREIYYWDSYFTMLGYTEDHGPEMLTNMLDNFAYLNDVVGHIPNGNRSYFCSRSQPPVASLMIELLARHKPADDIYASYIGLLESEYRFWMHGAGEIEAQGGCSDRVIRVGDGFLNRYWDDLDTPRPESFVEDVQLAKESSRVQGSLFRDIRAACESGWDFSTRWLGESKSLESIETTSVIPVDLNALIYKLEATLASCYESLGRYQDADLYSSKASCRKQLLQELFFSPEHDMFLDLNLADLTQRTTPSLAGVFPLFVGAANHAQASLIAKKLETDFLRAGGWVTSLANSSQQWDAPNGWAPLQWITYVGLTKYGFRELANAGALNWVNNNRVVYESTGYLLEKYNVDEIGLLAEGGEYNVQHGFGWTNGVLVSFMNALNIDARV
ncbi:alpha,alpha-trehalase [Arenicella sp. 4NH20-0111]|uniref:trehalase family glycosidase n=1 Tax=Arenicella sp. 4NH20-0111 TaxID=3127648 RepID=UPI003105AE45